MQVITGIGFVTYTTSFFYGISRRKGDIFYIINMFFGLRIGFYLSYIGKVNTFYCFIVYHLILIVISLFTFRNRIYSIFQKHILLKRIILWSYLFLIITHVKWQLYTRISGNKLIHGQVGRRSILDGGFPGYITNFTFYITIARCYISS